MKCQKWGLNREEPQTVYLRLIKMMKKRSSAHSSEICQAGTYCKNDEHAAHIVMPSMHHVKKTALLVSDVFDCEPTLKDRVNN